VKAPNASDDVQPQQSRPQGEALSASTRHPNEVAREAFYGVAVAQRPLVFSYATPELVQAAKIAAVEAKVAQQLQARKEGEG
jgi:hypothetical protein